MNQIIPNYAYGMAVCDTKAGPSLKGAVPTKIAEFLACGRPVVINEGLGDFDQLFAEYRAGVIISRNKANLTQKVEELLTLLNDPETPIRCRALAEDVFDMKIGVKKYMQVYEKISL
jgi:glycosyltransferase involved in cell wall biosynthesis